MVSQFPLSSDFVLLRDAMNQLLPGQLRPLGGCTPGLEHWHEKRHDGSTHAARCLCDLG